MMIPQRAFGAAYRSSTKADACLEKINYVTIKSAITNARKKGWIKKAGQGKRVNPRITEAGIRRLKNILPIYDDKRIWDNKLYLVTYDISERQRNDRHLLREYLKKIGCGMLQCSVWITPYNPRETLKEFIKEKSLKGAVIISDIGKDGTIGEEDIDTLINRVYNLEVINQRYQEFLAEFEDREDVYFKKMAISFLSVLKDDPQLPFTLLLPDWLGTRAYNLFLKKVKEGQLNFIL